MVQRGLKIVFNTVGGVNPPSFNIGDWTMENHDEWVGEALMNYYDDRCHCVDEEYLNGLYDGYECGYCPDDEEPTYE